MPYRPSRPLREWRGSRRALLDALANGATTQPLADAYVIRVVAEFQAFARALHAYGARRLVHLAAPGSRHARTLERAVTAGRRLDTGNPAVPTIATDFRRLGLDHLRSRLTSANPRWDSDTEVVERIVALRNALAHGNDDERRLLAGRGVVATVAWTRHPLGALDRLATTLDLLLWNHLASTFRRDPW